MADQTKNWYIASKGKKLGPLSEENLKSFYNQNKINGDTKVIKTGMSAWVSLSATGILDPEFDEDDLPPIPQDDIDDIKPAKKSNLGVIAVVVSVLAVAAVAVLVIAIINRGNNPSPASPAGSSI